MLNEKDGLLNNSSGKRTCLEEITVDGQTGVKVLCLRATLLGDQRMCMIVNDANKIK